MASRMLRPLPDRIDSAVILTLECKRGKQKAGASSRMKKTKTTEIIFERDEFYVVHSGAPVSLWCEACGEETPFAYPGAAALATRIPARTLFREAEAGHIHFSETPEGLLLFCLKSIQTKQ